MPGSMSGPLPSPRTVLSGLAEETLVGLALRVQVLRGRGLQVTDRPERHVTRYDHLMLGATLADLMSVAESFAAGRLLAERPAVSDDAVSTWQKRESAWKTEFGLSLDTDDAWQSLRGFAEVRNAIQHGLGRLTTRQLTRYREQTLQCIRAAGVELNGDRVVLTPDDVRRCHETCARVVRCLDEAAGAEPSLLTGNPREQGSSGRARLT